jgi:hypothetical protein
LATCRTSWVCCSLEPTSWATSISCELDWLYHALLCCVVSYTMCVSTLFCLSACTHGGHVLAYCGMERHTGCSMVSNRTTCCCC